MNSFSKLVPLRQPVTINLSDRSHASSCTACGARHIGVCDALSDDELAFLSRTAQRMTLPAGKLLMEEGASAQYFYNINSGIVRLFKSLPDGRRQITGFAGPGHFIGLASTTVNMISAEAINSVQLCRFSRAGLNEILAEYPAFERKLLDVAMHELVLNQQQILLLGRKTALERIATFLLSWVQRQDSCNNAAPQPSARLSLPLSRMDLADYLGLTIETVSRSLSSLKKDGLIDIPHVHEIVLLRPHSLAAIAEAMN